MKLWPGIAQKENMGMEPRLGPPSMSGSNSQVVALAPIVGCLSVRVLGRRRGQSGDKGGQSVDCCSMVHQSFEDTPFAAFAPSIPPVHHKGIEGLEGRCWPQSWMRCRDVAASWRRSSSRVREVVRVSEHGAFNYNKLVM